MTVATQQKHLSPDHAVIQPPHTGNATIGSPITISGTFNSLFRVLCNFPSRYLFAIGVRAIFSLGRRLICHLALYSQTVRLCALHVDTHYLLTPYRALTFYGMTFQSTWK